ncbi:MAG: hypothetical protein FJX64_08435 [Alphaproteobacteria bacterium]|nr:hypothetical protein [Alphaproteobacteria bacterium]
MDAAPLRTAVELREERQRLSERATALRILLLEQEALLAVLTQESDDVLRQCLAARVHVMRQRQPAGA